MSATPPRFRLGFLTHVNGHGDDASTYAETLELFTAADELGFDVGWVAQHHFDNIAGGLPAPWTFLAAAAAVTRRIRLSTAITILPLEHPVSLAEQLAVVDTISRGRVEIGVGSGYDPAAYAAFGVDMDQRRELTSAHLATLRDALDGKPLTDSGTVLRPAVRDFTDRIWQGVFSGPGAEHAARAGSNLLLNRATYGYDEPTDVVQLPWARSFLDAWSHAHAPRIGLSRLIFPAADRRTAIDELRDGTLRASADFVAQGKFPAGLGIEGYLERMHAFYGHPDEITAALQREQVLPLATDLLCQFNPGVPTHAAALRALELIATEIAPALGWQKAP
jgi:alkanesulfonate monooxygenase SsuD/methylene tetrahydromethanopterin reductase-like flavin-dependent oxidoreductase (luciferase family)